MMSGDIKKLRAQIDEIDAKIIELYEARMDIARAIGEYKMERQLPIYDEKREEEKLDEVFAAVSNKQYADGAAQLFITLMQASREMQEDMAGFSDDDFDWTGEPVEIRLEPLGDT